MATRNLVEGECGGANALVKLSSHMTQDRARRQEGYAPFQRVPPPHPFEVEKPFAESTTEELVGEFLAGQPRTLAPQTFHMGSLLQEMREIEEAEHPYTPLRGPAIAELAATGRWAEEFLTEEKLAEGEWSEEFLANKGAPPPPPPAVEQEVMWAQDYLDSTSHNLHAWDVGTEDKMLEDDKWVDEFVQSSDLEQTATELAGALEANPKFSNSEFVKFVKKLGSGELKIVNNRVVEGGEATSEQWAADFQEQQDKPLLERWEEEFEAFGEQSRQDGETNEEIWDALRKRWGNADEVSGEPWLTEFEKLEPFKGYQFEEDNPLIDHPDPFKAGLDRLQKGDIPSAVLLFEAAVQKNPNHGEAWQFLGTTNAENEQEHAAIVALKKCLELEPDNLQAWEALAASYTNESYGQLACHALQSWLRHNPVYKDLSPPDPPPPAPSQLSSFMTQMDYETTKNMYLKAIQMRPDHIDSKVQSNLGILFNLSGEYDKAVDCFNTALQVMPQDALTWNKLGATLANSSRSEEAVSAYHRALELSPGFIRCRYNLGISCINLGAHREAVEHFLAALNMQKSSDQPGGRLSLMSNNIWSTLRMTMSLMARPDLYKACDNKDLDFLNKEFPGHQ